MKPDRKEFLDLREWPLVVDNVGAGHILGFESHEIDIAANARDLHVLGDATNNQKKLFATADLLRLEPEDLGKIRRTLIKYWQRKNNSRSRIKRRDVEDHSVSTLNGERKNHVNRQV